MPPSFGSMENFYPRPPRGGRPVFRARYAAAIPISIHALREEGDRRDSFTELDNGGFLSTPSARRATNVFLRRDIPSKISIHALREEGDVRKEPCQMASTKFLSTPSARRATHDLPRHLPAVPISIHALREEGDCRDPEELNTGDIFLSTPSARRATVDADLTTSLSSNFYPRPPRGGRPSRFGSPLTHSGFLSTPSARRATYPEKCITVYHFISIHALREEGDCRPRCGTPPKPYFYPRPPRGGRRF